MSTVGIRDFRPKLHFSASSNWINDPNGLVYVNGVYHLFYQYNPSSTNWGPMHWGHASSTDLIHWKHYPIALYPDRLGTIFSGSAVLDQNNTSGFGMLGCNPMIAVYTQDLEGPNGHADRKQHQSIAYSFDCVHFIKYNENPVIPCPDGKTDFRDPKVFYCSESNCWGLVLSSGDQVEFYSSENLRSWKKTGHFGPFQSKKMPSSFPLDGIWECPDLIEFNTAEGKKSVLIISLNLPSHEGGSRTCYIVGSYDGSSFKPDNPELDPIWLDEGFDNYAGVTFSNTTDKILISWSGNWKYSAMCPTGNFCGIMTLARKLTLIKTPEGYRLSCIPLGLNNLISNVRHLNCNDIISSEVFGLSIDGENDGTVSFSNSFGQKLIFGIQDGNVYFDRSNAGNNSFSEEFGQPYFSTRKVKRVFQGKWHMDVIFDISQIELFIDNGTICMSSLIFPDTPYKKVSLDGNLCAKYADLQ
jgi:fructan beta-fructosidase